ncbi:MAG: DsbA family protein [Gammaproteobacteria bacterium]
MAKNDKVKISCFSDMLCIWAYISEVRLDELRRQFGSQIELSYHFLPIFGCAQRRICGGWKDRGEFNGYAEHVKHVCESFPHVSLHDDVWFSLRPASSANCHLFLKSVQLLVTNNKISIDPEERFDGRTLFEQVIWACRQAFFRDAKDISDLSVLFAIAEAYDLPVGEIRAQIDSGYAMAAMCCDIELKNEFNIDGSPTYVLNEGRQKLYGNVGYKVIEANVQEVLNRPENQISWC